MPLQPLCSSQTFAVRWYSRLKQDVCVYVCLCWSSRTRRWRRNGVAVHVLVAVHLERLWDCNNPVTTSLFANTIVPDEGQFFSVVLGSQNITKGLLLSGLQIKSRQICSSKIYHGVFLTFILAGPSNRANSWRIPSTKQHHIIWGLGSFGMLRGWQFNEVSL